MQYTGGHHESEPLSDEVKKQRLSNESAYLKKSFTLMGGMMFINLLCILFMIFTKRDDFDYEKKDTWTTFESMILSPTWPTIWGVGMLGAWGLLIFRIWKEPLAKVPCVNYALMVLLVLSANGLIMWAAQMYDPMLLLVPGILCVVLSIFMYFFAQLLMDKTFRKQRGEFVGNIESAGNNKSYGILATILFISIMLIFFIYGFKGMFLWAIGLVFLEVLFLLIDVAQLT